MSSKERAADESAVESDIIFIQTNLDLLQQLARTYFEKRGRGYILITSSLEEEGRDAESSCLLWYFSQIEVVAMREAESKVRLEERLFHERVGMIVKEYDPAGEFVLMLSEATGRSRVYRVRDQVVKHEMTLEGAAQNDIPPL